MTTVIPVPSGYTFVSGSRTGLSFAPVVAALEEHDETTDETTFIPIRADARGYFLAVPRECEGFTGLEWGQSSDWTARFQAWKEDR